MNNIKYISDNKIDYDDRVEFLSKCFIVGIVTLLTIAICLSIYYRSINTTISDEKNDIVALYMHQPYSYSVMMQNSNKLTTIILNANKEDIAIYADVPKGSNMWYKAKKTDVYCTYQYSDLEIHIHSVDDINTAGWNNGKFGSGQTVRVN